MSSRKPSSIRFVRADITKVETEVIVNTANIKARCGNGVDRAIFQAAGMKELLAERKNKPIMNRAEVFVTPSYNLGKHNVKHIFHILSTFWINGKFKEEEILRDCYKNCLNKAHKLQCKSIAFPLLGTGSFGYPIKTALSIAHDECWNYKDEYDDMDIIITVYNKDAVRACERFASEIREDISDNDVKQGIEAEYLLSDDNFEHLVIPETISSSFVNPTNVMNPKAYIERKKISEFESKEPWWQVKTLLTQYLNYAIDSLKTIKKSSEVYNSVELSSKTFSDIMSFKRKQMPSKISLLKLAVGLKLDIYNTEILLERAGCSHEESDMTEHVVKEHIRKYQYDYYNIRAELLEKDPDSPLLKE